MRSNTVLQNYTASSFETHHHHVKMRQGGVVGTREAEQVRGHVGGVGDVLGGDNSQYNRKK